MSLSLSLYLSISLSIYLSFYLSIYLSIYLNVYIDTCDINKWTNEYIHTYIYIYTYGAFSVPKYQPWNSHLASGSPDWYQHPPWFAEPNGWGTKPRSSAGLTELLRKCTGNSQETIRKPTDSCNSRVSRILSREQNKSCDLNLWRFTHKRWLYLTLKKQTWRWTNWCNYIYCNAQGEG